MNPDDLISQMLGAQMTPQDRVERGFQDIVNRDRFLPDAPEPSIPIVDRRYPEEAEDPVASPQEYIRRAFEELQDARVK